MAERTPRRDAARALRDELGKAPPSALVEALDDEQLLALTACLRDARVRQSAALDAATENALGHLPKLVRGAVRRIVLG